MIATEQEVKPGQDIIGLLALTAGFPEIKWEHGDDLCDCTFQRIGLWTNPYIARTLRVRMCCIWAELYTMFPQYVQEIQGYQDINNGDVFVTEPVEWDSEDDPMPRHLWYRHLAAKFGRTLAEIRERCANLEPPKAVLKGTGKTTKSEGG